MVPKAKKMTGVYMEAGTLHARKISLGERKKNLVRSKSIKNNSREKPVLILNSARAHSLQRRMYSCAPYFMRMCRF